MVDCDTQTLLGRMRAGDESAADQLFARYRPLLRRMVQVRMDDRLAARVDASDVVQESLLVACQRLLEYLGDAQLPFYPWLRRIAWDRLIDFHRRHIEAGRRSVSQEIPLDVSDASVVELAKHLAVTAAGSGEQLSRIERRERVRCLLRQLPEDDREILIMKHLETLSNAACAAVLGISVAAVKKRYVRALVRVRKLMGDDSQ